MMKSVATAGINQPSEKKQKVSGQLRTQLTVNLGQARLFQRGQTLVGFVILAPELFSSQFNWTSGSLGKLGTETFQGEDSAQE